MGKGGETLVGSEEHVDCHGPAGTKPDEVRGTRSSDDDDDASHAGGGAVALPYYYSHLVVIPSIFRLPRLIRSTMPFFPCR